MVSIGYQSGRILSILLVLPVLSPSWQGAALNTRQFSQARHPSWDVGSSTSNNEPCDRRDTLIRISSSLVCTMMLPSLPAKAAVPSIESLSCPESFSIVPLGIQNVVDTSSGQATQLRKGMPYAATTSDQAKKGSRNNSCQSKLDYQLDFGNALIQAKIYLPTPTTITKPSSQPLLLINSEDVLLLTVSSDAMGHDALVQAKLPVSDISHFPITASLRLSENSNDKDVFVTARILDGNARSTKCFGRGTARMLLLPGSGNDADGLVATRAAASIRLTQPQTADRLYTW